MPDYVTTRSIMPDVVYETTTLDFADLERHCNRESLDFEEIVEAVMDAIRGIKHIKHVQIAGVIMIVKWDYRLPTTHIGRRLLKLREVIESVLGALLAEAES